MIGRVIPKDINGTYIKTSNLDNSDGKFGYAIQEFYDKCGIDTNHGAGNDIPEMDLEIKSWDCSKRAHVSVGSASIKKVLNTQGECFLVKLKKWNLHKHNEGVITKTVTVNFSNIHDSLKEELKGLVKSMKLDSANSYTIGSSLNFVIERAGNKSLKLRIKSSRVDKLIGKSKSAAIFENLFEEQ